jgi:hypothetical protein
MDKATTEIHKLKDEMAQSTADHKDTVNTLEANIHVLNTELSNLENEMENTTADHE